MFSISVSSLSLIDAQKTVPVPIKGLVTNWPHHSTYDRIISDAFSVSGNQLYHTAALLMLQTSCSKLSHHPSLTEPCYPDTTELFRCFMQGMDPPVGVEFLYHLQRPDRRNPCRGMLVEDEVCRLCLPQRAAKGLRIRMQCSRGCT